MNSDYEKNIEALVKYMKRRIISFAKLRDDFHPLERSYDEKKHVKEFDHFFSDINYFNTKFSIFYEVFQSQLIDDENSKSIFNSLESIYVALHGVQIKLLDYFKELENDSAGRKRMDLHGGMFILSIIQFSKILKDPRLSDWLKEYFLKDGEFEQELIKENIKINRLAFPITNENSNWNKKLKETLERSLFSPHNKVAKKKSEYEPKNIDRFKLYNEGINKRFIEILKNGKYTVNF